MLVSIIIPAFCEKATIGRVLHQVLAADLGVSDLEKQVIVCDDGSSDTTADIVREVASRDSRVVLVEHATNRGKGAAIRTALDHAQGQWVLIQDADLEYSPTDYPKIVAELVKGHPVVYGSRFLTTRRPTGMQTANWLANRLLTWAANVLYRSKITDEATCYKAFRLDTIQNLRLVCEKFEFCPEVTAKLGRTTTPIKEVAITYHARGVDAGKKIRWTDGVSALWTLCKYRFWRP